MRIKKIFLLLSWICFWAADGNHETGTVSLCWSERFKLGNKVVHQDTRIMSHDHELVILHLPLPQQTPQKVLQWEHWHEECWSHRCCPLIQTGVHFLRVLSPISRNFPANVWFGGKQLSAAPFWSCNLFQISVRVCFVNLLCMVRIPGEVVSSEADELYCHSPGRRPADAYELQSGATK